MANLITLSRILLGPGFLVLFLRGFDQTAPVWLWLSVAALICIEISDLLDGVVARARNEVSELGKYFDPLADSLSRVTVFCAFLISGILPVWMFLIFIFRDIFVSGIRHACGIKGFVVSARRSGKVKALLQAIGGFGVLCVCLAHTYGVPVATNIFLGKHPGYFILLFPALYTAYSGFDYWWGNRKIVALS
jgi:CDP-diacylglycerol--glycerol-3-phosphate 3-phosphatidyltransferase